MAKARVSKSKAAPAITNAAVQNGLAEAVGFGSGVAGVQGFPGTERVSETGTIFNNLRGYLVSNFRQVLSEAYVEIGLVQTIVDVPVDDAMRGGIEIKSKQLDETQIEELQSEMERKDDLVIAAQAAKWNRLFGGAGIVLFTDQDPTTKLEIGNITDASDLEFHAADLWELFWSGQYVPETAAEYGLLHRDEGFEHYDYYGHSLHKSRVLRLKGIAPPSFVRPRMRGWGMSVVETLVRSLNQYLKATDLGFEVLDEFKLDVFKIKNLVTTLLAPGGTEKIQKRVQLANWQKNYQNALVMDSEDDFDHKQLSFAGLAEAMAGIRMQVASDMRMPLTKLFGISAAGFNSGEDDIEVYNAMIESQVRTKLKFHVMRMVELRSQSIFGFVPDDLKINFKPLRVLSAEQEENVKTQKFNRLVQAKQAGEITTEEFRDACNKGNLFDITLDTTDELISELEDQAAEAAGNEVAEGGAGGDKAKASKATAKPAKESKEAKEAKQANSAAFDRKSYEADGGDAWIDPRRKEFFMNPGKVDEALWARAKEASQAAFGEERWQFITWWYEKQGGKFN